MATITVSSAAANRSAKFLETGVVGVYSTLSLTVALSAGDVLQFVKVPAGAQVLELTFFNNEGAGNNYTFVVGDGGDDNRYITSTSSTGVVRAQATTFPYSYSAEDTIDITVGTVVSATATGSLGIAVFYVLDQQG